MRYNLAVIYYLDPVIPCFRRLIRFSLIFPYNEVYDCLSTFLCANVNTTAVKHESSDCFKGCLDDVGPVTALTEISLSTSYHASLHLVSQYSDGACVGPCGLLSCLYVYSKSSCKKWPLKLSGVSIHPSIHPSARNTATLMRWIFMEFHILDFQWIRTGQNYRHFTFMVSCQWLILIWRWV